jgi:Polysaccharide lyase family 4, domain II
LAESQEDGVISKMKVRKADRKSASLHIICFLFLFLGALLPATVPAQDAYQVISVPNGGTISGVVKWTGERPKPLVLPISKDVGVCDPQKSGTRDLERILINSDGEVENTVVFLKGVSRGKAWDPSQMHAVIEQKSCRYIPHITLVPLGSDLGMKSSDPILHTIHMTGSADYNLPFPMTDVVVSRPMKRPGPADLKCNAGHFWMNGTVMVIDSPYYALTDSHGYFRITGIPAGEYEIVAWHEGWKVDREDQVLDVGTQTKTKRYFFSDPMTWSKKVSVADGSHSTVDFTISEH